MSAKTLQFSVFEILRNARVISSSLKGRRHGAKSGSFPPRLNIHVCQLPATAAD